MKIIIYGQDRCTYCVSAKKLCEVKRYGYIYRDCADPAVKRELIGRLGALPKTVPQIFIGEVHIGGYDQLAGLQQKGELQQLVGGF